MSTRGTRSWRDVMPTYRSRWQQRNTMGTEKWEDAEPSYRYAYEMRSDPRYRGKSYRDAEGELRSDWERRHGDMPWDKAMYAVRDVFDGDSDMGEGSGTVELREEELRVRKESVETGEVEIGKRVVAQEQTVDVPVTREEVYVERRPVDRRADDRPISEGERIEVPVREERVEVTKEPHVYEEVSVGKRAVQETRRVSDTVRREEVDIDREGDVDIHGWDEPRAGRSYASEMRSNPRMKGRTFEEAEPELRSGYKDWSTGRGYRTGNQDPWDKLRQDVRDAWEQVKD